MKLVLLILIYLGSSVVAMACDKESLVNNLSAYIGANTFNYKKSADVFKQLEVDLSLSYQTLEEFIVGKNKLNADSFTSIEAAESLLVESVDELYDSQEQLLQQIGETREPDNLYGQITSCYPSKSALLIEAIELHIVEVKLEESNISAIFDTLYNYSTELLNIVEALNSWLSENKTKSVPKAGLFDDLFKLITDINSGSQCAKDLLNITHKNMCEVAQSLELNIPECSEVLFTNVGLCN